MFGEGQPSAYYRPPVRAEFRAHSRLLPRQKARSRRCQGDIDGANTDCEHPVPAGFQAREPKYRAPCQDNDCRNRETRRLILLYVQPVRRNKRLDFPEMLSNRLIEQPVARSRFDSITLPNYGQARLLPALRAVQEAAAATRNGRWFQYDSHVAVSQRFQAVAISSSSHPDSRLQARIMLPVWPLQVAAGSDSER